MNIIIIAAAIVVLILFLASIFNKFARLRNMVKDAWSNIDAVLKRRHDLIPNLVNTVKGYAAHEQKTLETVIQARNAAVAVAPTGDINAQIQAENQLQSSLRGLLAVAEAYPDLKADASFLHLQSELSNLEEHIERARRYYNSTVRENNTYGESLPGALFAGMFKYQHFNFFEADAADRENVNVNFS